MTFASEPPFGVSPGRETIAALDPFLYQEMRWCEQRCELQISIAVFECAWGRWELCLGCGEERPIGFSHTTVEAA